jgi:hypothetical protein
MLGLAIRAAPPYPTGVTSLTRRPAPQQEGLVLPGQVHSALTSVSSRSRRGCRLRPHGRQIRTGMRWFRCGCCCTLLLYKALEPWGRAFELCF